VKTEPFHLFDLPLFRKLEVLDPVPKFGAGIKPRVHAEDLRDRPITDRMDRSLVPGPRGSSKEVGYFLVGVVQDPISA